MGLLKVGLLHSALVVGIGALWFVVVVSTDDPDAGSTEALEVLGPMFMVIVVLPVISLGILLAWVTTLARKNEEAKRQAEEEGWEGFGAKHG